MILRKRCLQQEGDQSHKNEVAKLDQALGRFLFTSLSSSASLS